MNIKIKNYFSCRKNPKKIILKNGHPPDTPKKCKEEHPISTSSENWTIHVDFQSGYNNDKPFWVLHTNIDGLMIVPSSVIEDILYPTTDLTIIYIKPGDQPPWYVDLQNVSDATVSGNVAIAAGSGNVTIGDDNQKIFFQIYLKKFLNFFKTK